MFEVEPLPEGGAGLLLSESHERAEGGEQVVWRIGLEAFEELVDLWACEEGRRFALDFHHDASAEGIAIDEAVVLGVREYGLDVAEDDVDGGWGEFAAGCDLLEAIDVGGEVFACPFAVDGAEEVVCGPVVQSDCEWAALVCLEVLGVSVDDAGCRGSCCAGDLLGEYFGFDIVLQAARMLALTGFEGVLDGLPLLAVVDVPGLAAQVYGGVLEASS